MSQKVLDNLGQSPSTTFPVPNPTDFNALASMFQDIAQVLLNYGKMPYTNTGANTDAEKSSQKEQVGQLEQAEQGEESTLREQIIKISYDIDGKRTPAFYEEYGAILDRYRRGEFHDEIRCFHVSASNVRKERELLDKCKCINLSEFLHITYDELSIMINLLSYLNDDIALSATELFAVSNNLSCSLEKLQELHTQLEDFKLLHIVTIPA